MNSNDTVKRLLPDPFVPVPSSPSPAEKESEAERKLRRLLAGITIYAFMNVVFSIVSVAITMGIIFTSTTLTQDRRMFFASILGVCTLGLQIVICVARRDKTALLLFSTLSGNVSIAIMCLAIPYS